MTTVCVLNSDRWLHARLVTDAKLAESAALTDDAAHADIVIYPEPIGCDGDAPHRSPIRFPKLWSRVFVFSQADTPVVWAPGVYPSVSARHGYAKWVRGGAYVHYGGFEPDLVRGLELAGPPDLLWSFMGTVATCPALRGRLLQLADSRAVVQDTEAWNLRYRWQGGAQQAQKRQAMTDYAALVQRSSFVVCPRGRGPSSLRLFEAMRAGRCPVILSDDWLPPPFVDWDSCSIRVPERNVAQLPAVLREREGEAAMLGANARRLWEELYSPARVLNTIVGSCVDILAGQRRRVPRARVMAVGVASKQGARQLVRRRAVLAYRTVLSGRGRAKEASA